VGCIVFTYFGIKTSEEALLPARCHMFLVILLIKPEEATLLHVSYCFEKEICKRDLLTIYWLYVHMSFAEVFEIQAAKLSKSRGGRSANR
jgi:hypothetical protein